MSVRGLSFDFAAPRYEGNTSLCRGAIARCALVRRAEGAPLVVALAGVVRGKYKQ